MSSLAISFYFFLGLEASLTALGKCNSSCRALLLWILFDGYTFSVLSLEISVFWDWTKFTMQRFFYTLFWKIKKKSFTFWVFVWFGCCGFVCLWCFKNQTNKPNTQIQVWRLPSLLGRNRPSRAANYVLKKNERNKKTKQNSFQ